MAKPRSKSKQPPVAMSKKATEYSRRIHAALKVCNAGLRARELARVPAVALLLEQDRLDDARAALGLLGIGTIGRAEIIFGPACCEVIDMLRQWTYLSTQEQKEQIELTLNAKGFCVCQYGDLFYLSEAD